MSIFDSIISEGSEKYRLGDKAGSLLSSLLGLISDQTRGGLAGFLERFRAVGLGDTVDSWVGSNSNRVLSNEQVESALGTEATTEMARQAGLDHETTKTALGAMIPGVVDRLTPDGIVPTDDDLLSRLGGYLSGVGDATVSTTGVMASDTIDRFGSATAENITRRDDFTTDLVPDDDSPLKWLMPLILLGILVALGYTFCGGRAENAPAPAAVNTNVANSSVQMRQAANSNANTK